MRKIDVIGLGALNMDNIYRVERILEDGEAVVKEFASFPGGSAANTIYGLARLGVGTGFIGAVGDDAKGSLMQQDFQGAGVDTAGIKVKPGARTGSALCLSDETGRRAIYLLPGANSLLTTKDLKLTYIKQSKILHISSFVDKAQLEILLKLVGRLEPSVKISFSPGALYAPLGLEKLRPLLARTRLLFLNGDEMRQLTEDDITTGAETCLQQGCQTVVVTLGRGTVLQSREAVGYIMSAENEYLIEAVHEDAAPAADTTGAGDAFAAGFLFGFLNGRGPEQCGRLGDIVARFSVSRVGARAGLPTRDEVAACYQKLYAKQLEI